MDCIFFNVLFDAKDNVGTVHISSLRVFQPAWSSRVQYLHVLKYKYIYIYTHTHRIHVWFIYLQFGYLFLFW